LNKKVYLHTYGCQMNKLDSEVMLGLLSKEGYTRVDKPEEADVILYNTCSVREHAEDKVWSALGRARELKQENPQKIIGITGCMAQNIKGQFFKRAPHVDFVVGTAEEHRIGELIAVAQKEKKQTLAVKIDHQASAHPAVFRSAKRTSGVKAWVRIMTGCDQMCSYCVVPFTRGRERSRPAKDIISEVVQLEAEGYQEIVLLGQNVNSYGSDLGGETHFAELLHQLDRRTNIPRIRFLTSHPNNASRVLADVMADASSVCEHLHLPVQSGSDRILSLMNRGYTIEKYRKLIDHFRKRVPGLSISTDIIVGYPTETEAEFKMTLDLIRDIGYDFAYLFKYSPRKGTPAYKETDDVSEGVKKDRHQRIAALQNEISLARNKAYEGKVLEVLVERRTKKDPERWVGRARDFRKVSFRMEGKNIAKRVPVKITSGLCDYLVGEPYLNGQREASHVVA